MKRLFLISFLLSVIFSPFTVAEAQPGRAQSLAVVEAERAGHEKTSGFRSEGRDVGSRDLSLPPPEFMVEAEGTQPQLLPHIGSPNGFFTPFGRSPAGIFPEDPDLGDWSNDAAAACILGLTVIFYPNYIASFVPGWGKGFEFAAWLVDLGLKYCAPFVQPEGKVVINPGATSCSYDLYLPANGTNWDDREIVGHYSNVLGLALTPGNYGIHWGLLDPAEVLHFNSDVDVILQHTGERVSSNNVRLNTGVHTFVWRGETLISLMDRIYIPSPTPGYTKEQLKKMTTKQLLKETLKNFLKKSLTKVGKKYATVNLLEMFTGERHGVYNLEFQPIYILDSNVPTISTSKPVIEIEATDPGGMSRSKMLPTLLATIQADDLCDPEPTVTPLGLPAFIKVEDQKTITWQVKDHGPVSGSGGQNLATTAQTVTIVDTKPPIVVAPPSVVTETTTIPADIALGQPLVFDLVDMDPVVTNDAPALFPAGVTEVTWWATDQSGNESEHVTQIVNVKAPGTNNAPGSDGAAYDAISFEPITITLTADDPDGDPLWFQIEDEPPNGFFVAPLLPYFIEDYRVESNETFGEVEQICQTFSGPFQYQYPWDASFVDVDDEGNSYVIDKGSMFCDVNDHLNANGRIAVFGPEGTLQAHIDWNPAPQNIYIDSQQELIVVTDHTSGGVGTVVLFDLDLNQQARFRTDVADIPPGENALNFPTDAVVDHQGILYVTDRNVIRAYKTELVPGGLADEPVLLGSILSSTSGVVESLAVDSENNLYASLRDLDRIYKFAASGFDDVGDFAPGEFVGWMGRCDSELPVDDGEPHCDVENQRSIGFSCTDDSCAVRQGTPTEPCSTGQTGGFCTAGTDPGQFHEPRGIAVDPKDVLYVTDYQNLRVERFTPEGFFAGQAKSACDGTCFILGDFGNPRDITVNSNHFYILDNETNLLHVSETTPITPLTEDTARVTYQSDNNFVGVDSFTFTSSDGLATSAPAAVSFNVSRNFRAPFPHTNLSITTDEDVPAGFTLRASDPDGDLDVLTFDIAETPVSGAISGSGAERTYTPDADFAGSDVFAFTVSDGVFTSQPATVTVTVNPINDPPLLEAPAGATYGLGYTATFTATLTDPDPIDEHTLSLNWGDGTVESEGEVLEDGTLTGPVVIENLDGTGVIQAEHIYTSAGEHSLVLCVTDGNAAQNCHTTLVSVMPMADLEVTIDPSGSPLAEGHPLTYTLEVVNLPPTVGSGLSATNIVLSHTWGEHQSFQFANPSQGSCASTGDAIVCELDTLPVGASATVELGVDLDSSALAGVIMHSAADAVAGQPDPSANNLVLSNVTVVVPADYLVDNVEDGHDSLPGDGVCASADNICTLRAAIEEANAQEGQQHIALADQTYALGDLVASLLRGVTEPSVLTVSDDLMITGLGADRTVIYGQSLDRVLEVQNGVELTLTDLAVSGGKTDGDGGGVLNSGGTLNLAGVLLGNNQAANGGAIYNDGGVVSVNRSLFSGNRADFNGGAIYSNGGEVNLTNTTLSMNDAGSNGGGIHNSGDVSLTNVTIGDNRADTGGGGLINGGTVELINTILAGNMAPSGPNCSGVVTSQGNNLIEVISGCTLTGASQDIIDLEANLAPLGDYGGPTFTYAIGFDSPALDAGTCVVAVDQRGVERPQLGGCDIGAFEFEPLSIYLPLIVR